MPSARDDHGHELGSADGPGSKGKPWGYTGDIGPASEFRASGTAPSSIDLAPATHGPVPALTLRWGTLSPVRLLNTGHTLQVVVPPARTSCSMMSRTP